MTPKRVQRTYITLVLLQTFAASLIWGINTLFLLDAGLTITGAFVANAAFTAGMVIFEVPTGVVADTVGRRASFLLGAVTLFAATLAYLGLWYVEAELVWWILVSIATGLGFTFFSGATEAWLVDALDATGYTGPIETVFGRGQSASGAATLIGTIAGGLLATVSLGLPYLVRSLLLVAVVVVAWFSMHDIGYTPVSGGSLRSEVATIVRNSIDHGFRNPPVRLFLLAAPFSMGVGIWVFYAFQPYLLDLFGNPDATWLAGVAAAVFAIAQMIGGATVSAVRRMFSSRTGVLIGGVSIAAIAIVGVGLAELLPSPAGFWAAIILLASTALVWALTGPIQQAFLNSVIPSAQRATVLSFSSLMGSAGGVVFQPALGRVADVWSIGIGYVIAGVLFAVQLPFLVAVKAMKLDADRITAPDRPGSG